MNTEDIRDRVESIAKEGGNVAERVREVVEEAAKTAGDMGDKGRQKLTSVVMSSLDGATNAVKDAAPEDAESTLRQVIDGLGDGIQRAANATKLAVEESTSGGRAYAESDLKSVAEDFKTIGQLFVETVEKHAKSGMGQAESQIGDLRSHAQTAIDTARPDIEAAIQAVTSDPVGLAGESAQAAANLAQETAGALFGAVGKILGGSGSGSNSGSGDQKKPE